MTMSLSTLCYIRNNDKYLMLHRVSKQHDVNAGKWIGVGGHLEDGESPDECMKREVKEETGFTLTEWRFRGVVTFIQEDLSEYMFLYTATKAEETFDTPLPACDEGELAWVDMHKIDTLPLWEGDRIFLKLLEKDAPCFSLKLCYDKAGRLTEAVLDGNQGNVSVPLS